MDEQSTYKTRALAGLSPTEQQDLLASAGALGIAPHDPFWVYQAIITQAKQMMADAKRDSSESLAIAKAALDEARAVSKSLRPAADVAVEHIRATVDAAQVNLTKTAAVEIGKRVAIEAARISQQQAESGRGLYQAIGFGMGSIATACAFALGSFLAARGVPLSLVPAAIKSIGLSTLLLGQGIIVAGLCFFLLVSRKG